MKYSHDGRFSKLPSAVAGRRLNASDRDRIFGDQNAHLTSCESTFTDFLHSDVNRIRLQDKLLLNVLTRHEVAELLATRGVYTRDLKRFCSAFREQNEDGASLTKVLLGDAVEIRTPLGALVGVGIEVPAQEQLFNDRGQIVDEIAGHFNLEPAGAQEVLRRPFMPVLPLVEFPADLDLPDWARVGMFELAEASEHRQVNLHELRIDKVSAIPITELS